MPEMSMPEFQCRDFNAEDVRPGRELEEDEAGRALRRPPVSFNSSFVFRVLNDRQLLRGDQLQYLIHCFLNPGIRPMKLPRGLRGELTKNIPILHGVQGAKNFAGTHGNTYFPLKLPRMHVILR
jgi:hypothetical protein